MAESFDLQDQRNITAELNKQLDALKNAKEVYSTISDFASKVSDELNAVTNELEKMSPDIRDINLELNEVVKSVLAKTTDLVRNYQYLGTDLFDQINTQEKLVELEDLKSKVFSGYFGQNLELQDLLIERIGIIEDEIGALGAMAEQQEVLNEQINTGADHIMNMFDRIRSGIESLPGGGFLTSMLGFDKLRDDIRTGVIAGLREGALQIGGLSTKLIVGLSAVVVLLSLAVERFFAIDHVMREIRDQTGLIGDDLEHAAEMTRRLNRDFQRFGLDLEGAAVIVTSLVDEFGSVDLITREIEETTIRIHKALGLSADEAAKISRIFDTMSALTNDTASNLVAATIQLAEAANVAPQRVLSDIASSGEKIFTVMGGTAEEIAKAAIFARQLGSSLDTVVTIAEGLLDFETSIEKTMNASVLLGRSLNFEQARYLSFVGKTEEAMRLILKEIGGISAFQNRLPFEQRAIADALGVSADELIKMVYNQERLNDLSSGNLSIFEKFQRGATLSEILNAEDVMTPLEDVSASFKSILVSLAEVLAPLLEMVIIPGLRMIARLLAAIGVVINGVGGGVRFITDTFENLLDMIGNVSNSIQTLFSENVGEWIQKAMVWVDRFLGVFGKIASLFGVGDIQTSPVFVAGNTSAESAAVVRAATRTTRSGLILGDNGTDMSGVERKMDQLINVVAKPKPINIDGRKVGDTVATATVSL